MPRTSASTASGSATTWCGRRSCPSPHLCDPMVTLTWAAAVTDRVDLGTSVLVVPQHSPLELANALATLGALSGAG
ncbi:MAG: LLM class flavin-dependent oxidoreductase [Acidimicrobiales bacterium]